MYGLAGHADCRALAFQIEGKKSSLAGHEAYYLVRDYPETVMEIDPCHHPCGRTGKHGVDWEVPMVHKAHVEKQQGFPPPLNNTRGELMGCWKDACSVLSILTESLMVYWSLHAITKCNIL